MARRSGGRQARHAQRSAPLAEELKPVRPGERGGQYQPFAKADLDAVVANIFRILEEVGFKDATPHCIAACQAVGAIIVRLIRGIRCEQSQRPLPPHQR